MDINNDNPPDPGGQPPEDTTSPYPTYSPLLPNLSSLTPGDESIGITGFGYRLRNQRRKRLEVEQLKQQYQPLAERTSDYNG